MKYLCFGYYDEEKFHSLTQNELAALAPACRPHDEALRQTGRLVEVGSLAASKDSVSLRPRNGKVTVTDGPYAETKELIGSYFIIEAQTMDEAIRVASLHPAARMNEQLGWGIEIRPIEVCRGEQAARGR